MQTILLTQKDQGKTVEAHVGDKLIVNLAENPTTGYRWAIDGDDGQIIKLRASDFNRPPPGAPMGAGGKRVLSFEAIQAGRSTVRLKLWRGWEGDTTPVERYAVTINVKP